MKRATKSRLAQWAWFAGLWCLGLVVTATLSYMIRWLMRMG